MAKLNNNLARSGICLGQIRIPIWHSQIPDLAKFLLGQHHIPKFDYTEVGFEGSVLHGRVTCSIIICLLLLLT